MLKIIERIGLKIITYLPEKLAFGPTSGRGLNYFFQQYSGLSIKDGKAGLQYDKTLKINSLKEAKDYLMKFDYRLFNYYFLNKVFSLGVDLNNPIPKKQLVGQIAYEFSQKTGLELDRIPNPTTSSLISMKEFLDLLCETQVTLRIKRVILNNPKWEKFILKSAFLARGDDRFIIVKKEEDK
jgi:hypothetical protein